MTTDIAIVLADPCVPCAQQWETASIGQLLAYQLNENVQEVNYCKDHAAELRASLNEAGFRWLDESMKVKA